jgi:hypothetical protein
MTHLSHIRVPMTIEANDYNLCGAKPSNADIPLREARRAGHAVLAIRSEVCTVCLTKMKEQQ